MKARLGAPNYIGLALLLSSAIAHAAEVASSHCEHSKSLEVQYSNFRPTQVEILRPCILQDRLPYVVFTNYLALVDKDYYSGANPEDAPNADRKSDVFLFGALARELTTRGFTVVKYDALAVHASLQISNTPQADIVSQDELLRITRDDFSGLLNSIVQATDQALGTEGKRPIIFVAHSGGAFTVGDYFARFAQRRGTSRKMGFVGISPSVSSDTGSQRSYRDYWIRSLQQCLQHSEATACLAQFKDDPLFGLLFNEARRQRIDEIFTTTAEKTRLFPNLNEYLTTVAAEVDSSNRASTEGVGYLNKKYKVQAKLINSLIFRTPSAESISCYSASSRLIFGSNDLALSSSIERAAWETACGKQEDVILIDGVGHSLGQDRYVGPIRQEAKAVVVDSILKVADDLR